MQWLNEPASWQRTGGVLTVSVDPGTDFWCQTGYGYIRDSGHVYGELLAGDLDVSVRIRGTLHTQYDQAGIMLRADERTWLKTGVEFFEGQPRLSTVLTLGRSSWTVTSLPEDVDEIVLRVARRGDAVEVRYATGADEPAQLAALVFLPPECEVLAGVMCAAPEGPGFIVTFHDLHVASADWAADGDAVAEGAAGGGWPAQGADPWADPAAEAGRRWLEPEEAVPAGEWPAAGTAAGWAAGDADALDPYWEPVQRDHGAGEPGYEAAAYEAAAYHGQGVADSDFPAAQDLLAREELSPRGQDLGAAQGLSPAGHEAPPAAERRFAAVDGRDDPERAPGPDAAANEDDTAAAEAGASDTAADNPAAQNAAEEGAAGDDVADDAVGHSTATADIAVDDAAADNAAADEDAAGDATADEGAAGETTEDEVTAAEAAADGTAQDDDVTDGSAEDGTAGNGTAGGDAAAGGAAVDGTAAGDAAAGGAGVGWVTGSATAGGSQPDEGEDWLKLATSVQARHWIAALASDISNDWPGPPVPQHPEPPDLAPGDASHEDASHESAGHPASPGFTAGTRAADEDAAPGAGHPEADDPVTAAGPRPRRGAAGRSAASRAVADGTGQAAEAEPGEPTPPDAGEPTAIAAGAGQPADASPGEPTAVGAGADSQPAGTDPPEPTATDPALAAADRQPGPAAGGEGGTDSADQETPAADPALPPGVLADTAPDGLPAIPAARKRAASKRPAGKRAAADDATDPHLMAVPVPAPAPPPAAGPRPAPAPRPARDSRAEVKLGKAKDDDLEAAEEWISLLTTDPD